MGHLLIGDLAGFQIFSDLGFCLGPVFVYLGPGLVVYLDGFDFLRFYLLGRSGLLGNCDFYYGYDFYSGSGYGADRLGGLAPLPCGAECCFLETL